MNQRWQLSKAQAFTAHDAGCAACVLPSIAPCGRAGGGCATAWISSPHGAKESELAKCAKRYLPMLLGCEQRAA